MTTVGPVRVGVLGCGNVGSALVGLIEAEAATIERRTGLTLELASVAVRDVARHSADVAAAPYLTTDSHALVGDPSIDVVVEVIGGTEPAFDLVVQALKAGKPVVTANKELVAVCGSELASYARAAGVDLLYEAAVGGAVPLIRPLRESLAGERMTRVMGIVNGTTNYILTRMTDDGLTYAEALGRAKSLGYAEADPTDDVEGYDAAYKAAIIASTAFGRQVQVADVAREGITGVSADDIFFARRLGYVVKLLAVAESGPAHVAGGGAGAGGGSGTAGRECIAVRVHPAMVPVSHPLASVRDAFNAVFIEGDAIGELMLYGRGAGGLPTAAAVLGDLIDAAHNLRSGGGGRSVALPDATICPAGALRSEYYLRLEVADEPGVLAAVAGVFGSNEVSIRSMEQVGMAEEASLIFITHEAAEPNMSGTVDGLGRLPAVKSVGSVIRVIAGPTTGRLDR